MEPERLIHGHYHQHYHMVQKTITCDGWLKTGWSSD